MYLTPQQQLAIGQAKLADTQRQIREQNALLEQTKAVRAGKEKEKNGLPV
jgi:hypothetical protein